MSLLEVSNLRVRLHTHQGAVDAVRGIDFTLHRGETLGLVGESGCGKSLTARFAHQAQRFAAVKREIDATHRVDSAVVRLQPDTQVGDFKQWHGRRTSSFAEISSE